MLSVFTRTAGVLALSVLLAAQALDWTDQDKVVANTTIVAFGLLGALIGGLIAMGWAYFASPAVTPLGKALRSAVQALLSAPLAGLVIKSQEDFVAIEKLIVPTLVAMALAFLISLASNLKPAPSATSTVVTLTPKPVPDFLGLPTTTPVAA